MPPDSIEDLSAKEIAPFKTEWDVISTLKKIGHEVSPVGVYNNLGVIGNALMEQKPHVAFNLLEEFHGYPLYDQHVVSYLELMKQPYTGCNPRGLTISHDKALSKMVLAYHHIHVPAFAVFHMNRKVQRSRRLKFPLLVKSISEEGSVGIAQASIVNDDAKLAERVEFIHRQTKTHAIPQRTRRFHDGGWKHFTSIAPHGAHQTFFRDLTNPLFRTGRANGRGQFPLRRLGVHHHRGDAIDLVGVVPAAGVELGAQVVDQVGIGRPFQLGHGRRDVGDRGAGPAGTRRPLAHSAVRTSRTPAPYLASLFSPTPLTVPSAGPPSIRSSRRESAQTSSAAYEGRNA